MCYCARVIWSRVRLLPGAALPLLVAWIAPANGRIWTISLASLVFLAGPIAGAMVFNYVITSENIPATLSAALKGFDLSPLGFLLLVNLLLLVLGAFLEGSTIILVILPVLLPTARALGIVPGYSASFKALVRLYSAAKKHAELIELYDNTASLQDRTVGTGILSAQLALPSISVLGLADAGPGHRPHRSRLGPGGRPRRMTLSPNLRSALSNGGSSS